MDNRRKITQESEKALIVERIKGALKKHREILFAYLHGSFIQVGSFRDIDIAVYLKKFPDSILEYELDMETELTSVVSGIPVDIRILNRAPLSFRYNVIKNGEILFERDDETRTDFQEATISAYLDFLPYRNVYLRETLGVKI